MYRHITNKILIAAAMLSALAVASCHDIKDDDRFIELPPVEKKRVVLMEEFTGQLCVNCPAAHEVITSLLKQYPENLISVSIHGGGDAFSFSEEALPGYGLRNTEGQEYCDAYKIASLPAAVVNRSTGSLTSDQWADAIRKEMEKPSHLELALDAAKSDDKTIDVTVEVTAYDKVEGALQLWVVESGITSLQLTPQGWKNDYEHNHVFRASVNGHDGVKATFLPNTDKQVYNYKLEVRDHWTVDNLSIVAFVYTASGVEQAIEAKVN